MNRPIKPENEVGVRDLIAQALCKSHKPGIRWDALHDAAKSLWRYKADKILKDTGYENAKLVRQGAPLVVPDKEELHVEV